PTLGRISVNGISTTRRSPIWTRTVIVISLRRALTDGIAGRWPTTSRWSHCPYGARRTSTSHGTRTILVSTTAATAGPTTTISASHRIATSATTGGSVSRSVTGTIARS